MEFTPKWIAWVTTRRCNLHCIHCRSSSEQEVNDHPDFSIEEAFRIIDDIVSYAKPVIVLSGGEPLVRKDIFDIARYGNDKGLRMCLATNGTLVTDEICDKIKTSGIRIVSLSLDGSEESVHDDFAGEHQRYRDAAHALKGSAGSVGAANVYEVSGRACRLPDHQMTLQGAHLLKEMRAAFDRARRALLAHIEQARRQPPAPPLRG